jgi:catalase
MTAGPRGPQLLQDVWCLEKLAHSTARVLLMRWVSRPLISPEQ